MDTSQWSRAHLAQCDFILEVSISTNTVFPSEFTVTDTGLEGDGGSCHSFNISYRRTQFRPGHLQLDTVYFL